MISSPAIQLKKNGLSPKKVRPQEHGEFVRVCLLLAAIVLASYWKSLQCFFFADDLLCLDYLYKIFNGEPQLLFERLLSAWQDPSISLLYRPFADLSLAFDYAIWQSNPLGYHLTNMLLHLCASVSCFVFVETVLRFGKIEKTTLPAFLAAAIFAAYPLHVEPVLWICCRTDLAATALILFSLSLAIKLWHSSETTAPSISWVANSEAAAIDGRAEFQPVSKNGSAGFQASPKIGNADFQPASNCSAPAISAILPASNDHRIPLLLISCIAYTSALLFKESVACALPILVLYLLLYPSPRNRGDGAHAQTFESPTLRTRLFPLLHSSIAIAKFVAPFIALTICYFAIRLMILGTPGGGYMGGLGAALNGSWQTRIFDPDIPMLLALASNVAVIKEGDALITVLHAVFFAIAGAILLRIPILPWSSRTSKLLLFFAVGTLCALAPTFQVAGIPPTLSNSRIFYLASAFFLPLAVLAIYPLCESAHELKLVKQMRIIGATILSTLTLTYMCMCSASIAPWLEGSEALRSIQREVAAKIDETRNKRNENSRISIINMPASISGAHLIYEFREVASLLGPAFYRAKNYQRDLLAIDEYPDFVAPRRQELETSLCRQSSTFWFSQRTNRLVPVLPRSRDSVVEKVLPERTKLAPCKIRGQKALFVPIPYTKALASDQIEIEIDFQRFAGRPILALALTKDSQVPLDKELFFVMLEYGKQGRQKFRVPTSVLRHSIDNQTSKQLYVRISDSAQLVSASLVPGSRKAKCSVLLNTLQLNQNGKFLLRPDIEPLLLLDASHIPNAKGVYVEISQPNQFLHFGCINASDPTPSPYKQEAWNFSSTDAVLKIEKNKFKKASSYQIRACATDAKGKLLDFFSDPIEIDLRTESTNHRHFY